MAKNENYQISFSHLKNGNFFIQEHSLLRGVVELVLAGPGEALLDALVLPEPLHHLAQLHRQLSVFQ